MDAGGLLLLVVLLQRCSCRLTGHGKSVNFRQVEKKILDRILSPTIYDSQAQHSCIDIRVEKPRPCHCEKLKLIEFVHCSFWLVLAPGSWLSIFTRPGHRCYV